MIWEELISNRILISALAAWWLAQALKVPIEYWMTRRWNWALWFSAGGMPSSHTALVMATMLAIGLYSGFDTPTFALSVVLAMIVTYDATGVRREAGMHAQKINLLINELFSGHPITEESLKEVLGHTPRQVLAGMLLGFAITLLIWVL